MSEKLYYQDSHLFDFTARVLSCEARGKAWAVALDRTAFFPGGGGQPADTGTLAGVRVLDMREEGGGILHLCAAPLAAGDTVEGRVDREERFRLMQNHSGEHVLSGLVHRKYGFENVGFHMGSDCVTVDFSGELSWEELLELEREANAVVWQNLPVRAWFPDSDELARLAYRSKLELTENVRLVEIGDIDRCACCAPHVSFTGEIGLIKLLDAQRHRGGVRVTMVCGADALREVQARQESVTAISRALSARRGEVAEAVQRLQGEQQKTRERADALSMAYIRFLAGGADKSAKNRVLFDALLDETAQRELVNLLTPGCEGLAAVFCGDDESGWRYVVGREKGGLRALTRAFNAAVSGRGGGSDAMLQGRAGAKRQEIECALEALEI